MATTASTPPIPRPVTGFALESLASAIARTEGVRRRDLHFADRMIVRTKNSTYSIAVLNPEEYWVSGGWFDSRAESPSRVGISGCTWGGTAIASDLVAAPGMFLEFSNGVKTTRIQEVRLLRGAQGQLSN